MKGSGTKDGFDGKVVSSVVELKVNNINKVIFGNIKLLVGKEFVAKSFINGDIIMEELSE